MTHGARSHYPIVAVSCAMLYGYNAALVGGVLLCQFLAERPLTWEWVHLSIMPLVAPGVAMAGGMLAVFRPRLGGWLYLAGGLVSIMVAASFFYMAGSVTVLSEVSMWANTLLGFVSLPMLTIAGLLLRVHWSWLLGMWLISTAWLFGVVYVELTH